MNEQNFLPIATCLEELKLKREQVANLEDEISRLNLKMIEKNAVMVSNLTQYKIRDDKQTRFSENLERSMEECISRYQRAQDEIVQYEKTVVEQSRKLSQSQSERELLEVKVKQYEQKIKSVYQHASLMNTSLTEAMNCQRTLDHEFKNLEAKCVLLQSICDKMQSHATEIDAKASEKWNLACQFESRYKDLEKQLCEVQARLSFHEQQSIALDTQTEIQALKERLSRAEEREKYLEKKLQDERQERILLEKEHARILTCLGTSLNSIS